MKTIKNAFTFIELIVSITIFTILMWVAFWIFPFITWTIKKLWNEHSLLKDSIKIKEELTFNNKDIAFYSYTEIDSIINTQYDFENMFRKNIKELIINGITDKYWLADYRLDEPSVCKLPYSSEQYFSEWENAVLIDEFLLGSCTNTINSPNFDEQYKILSVIDRDTLIVNIYFSYNSILHKISTSLITDLSNDNIISTKLSSWKINIKTYNWFQINKFTWVSYNYCTLNDSTSWECSFTDFLYNQWKSGNLYIDMYKLSTYWDEIQIKTSYILRTLYSLNY